MLTHTHFCCNKNPCALTFGCQIYVSRFSKCQFETPLPVQMMHLSGPNLLRFCFTFQSVFAYAERDSLYKCESVAERRQRSSMLVFISRHLKNQFPRMRLIDANGRNLFCDVINFSLKAAELFLSFLQILIEPGVAFNYTQNKNKTCPRGFPPSELSAV